MGFLLDPYLMRYPEAKAIMMDGNPWSLAHGKVLNNHTMQKNVRKAFSIRGNLETDIPDSCPWELAETITLDAFENPDELNFNFNYDIVIVFNANDVSRGGYINQINAIESTNLLLGNQPESGAYSWWVRPTNPAEGWIGGWGINASFKVD